MKTTMIATSLFAASASAFSPASNAFRHASRRAFTRSVTPMMAGNPKGAFEWGSHAVVACLPAVFVVDGSRSLRTSC